MAVPGACSLKVPFPRDRKNRAPLTGLGEKSKIRIMGWWVCTPIPCSSRGGGVPMPRWWSRLVACITLATFLVANRPATLPAAVPLLSSSPSACHTQGCQCSRCAACRAATCACHRSTGTDSSPQVKTLQNTPHQHPSAPCPSCPCPGGCMYCSHAKAPCLLSDNLLPPPSPCVGHSFIEIAPLYLPPLCGELMRPPRV